MMYRLNYFPDHEICRFSSAPRPSEHGKSGNGASALRNDLRFVHVDDVSFAWQPIASPDNTDILYYEGLARSVDRQGGLHSMGDAICGLERLGLIRSFDSRVVAMALDELALHPTVRLGVNISARSAVLDAWWDVHRARLRAAPQLASRLVIEITETAPLGAVSEVRAFMDEFRGFGCKFALDDFGVGHMAFSYLLALSPDIVKIPSIFLHAKSVVGREPSILARLAGLADLLAPTVVVEGIETEEQSRMAYELGLVWQQGYLLGRPSLHQPWKEDRCNMEA